MLTIAITVSTEVKEFRRILTQISDMKFSGELLIQFDEDTVTPEVEDVFVEFLKKDEHDFSIKTCHYPLSGHFGKFKSNLADVANGEWILQLDVDELLGDDMITFIEQNSFDGDFLPGVGKVAFPRINIVRGITPEYLRRMRWQTYKVKRSDIRDESFWDCEIINYPDNQVRLYRRKDSEWRGAVHEQLHHPLPLALVEQMDMAIIHVKSFARQQKQNSFYEKLA